MTTRADRYQRAPERNYRPDFAGVPNPRHHAPRGLTAGVQIGQPSSVPQLARLTEAALNRMSANADAEFRRIGRHIDADGYYKDGILSNSEGKVIVPPTTGGVSTVLAIDTTATDIVNTATLTTIFDATIEGGVMGPEGYVELAMFSDYFNNTGSSRGIQFQVSIGGTVYYDYTSAADFGTGGTRRVNTLYITLLNTGSEADNILRFLFTQSPAAPRGTVTTGIGGFANDDRLISFLGGSLPITENTAVDRNLTVKIAHSAAHVSLSFRQQYSILRKTA